ncbi:MAG: SH3 domain-containing protein [Spirochaetota bacterium]|nr:SH3 domain-containing protein [Spirochaetota bacterium]
MMKKVNLLIYSILFVFFASFTFGAEKTLIITLKKVRVYKKSSPFSKKIGVLSFGTHVKILGMKGKWVQVSHPGMKKPGYVHRDSLIDEKGFKRQAEAVKSRKNKKTKWGVSKFSEEDETAAATKGFSEVDETAAATKGFSEEDETAAATKGFNKDVEKKYREKNKGLRYDLVDLFEDKGDIYYIRKDFKRWRKKGHLGEYGPYYPERRKK